MVNSDHFFPPSPVGHYNSLILNHVPSLFSLLISQLSACTMNYSWLFISNTGYHLERLLDFLRSSNVTCTLDCEHKFCSHAHRQQQARHVKYTVEIEIHGRNRNTQ